MSLSVVVLVPPLLAATHLAVERDVTRRSPYSAAGPEALRALGLNVFMPLRYLRNSFSQVLPDAANDGYFGAFRAALRRGDVKPGDRDGQMQWLAERLRLSAPADDDLSFYWRESWAKAAEGLDVPARLELGVDAKRALLEELLRLPDSQSRLASALRRAFAAELRR